jgi:hypothetical protein
VPFSRHTLELYVTSVSEGQPGTSDQILDGARNDNLIWLCLCSDARPDMHGNAAYLPVHDLALAGMQSGADMQPQLPYPVADRLRAPDGARRSVEGREEAVPGGVDLAS